MKKCLALLILLVFVQTAKAQNTITTDTILQLSTCAGGNVLVPFSTTGNFSGGNVFTAQLSNAFGQFTNPIDIGASPFNLGFILATIPSNTNFGILYKIRVVASNPAIIGDPCPNTLIITQVAQLNQIIVQPNDTACVGDTVTLTALNPADSYAWSTGETTASIDVTQSGNYSVTTTDFLGCESDTSANVVFEICNVGIKENQNPFTFSVYPNPSAGEFTIVNTSTVDGFFQVRIVNQLGQIILEQKDVPNGEMSVSIEEPGVYFIELDKAGFSGRQRLIVR